jgi:hypothetical protein
VRDKYLGVKDRNLLVKGKIYDIDLKHLFY